MTKTQLISAGLVVFFFAAALAINWSMPAQASSFPGTNATVATSSMAQIGANAVLTVMATSSCSARIITTQGSAITLTFSDYVAPTGNFGHWQSASTTVAYDGGQYGCGLVKAYSYTAQTLTVTDTR